MLSGGMRSKLLIFSLLVSILPIVGISVLAYHYAKKATEEVVISHLVSVAELKKNVLDDWVQEILDDVEVSSLNSEFMGLILNGDDYKRSEEILEQLVTHYSFSKAYVVDQNGEIVSSTKRSDIGEITQAEYVLEPMSSSEIYINDFLLTVKQIPTLIVSAPIFPQKSLGQTNIGVLVVEVELNNHVFPILNAWPGMGETGETLIAKRYNQEVVFLNKLRHQNEHDRNYHDLLHISVNSADALPAIFSTGGQEGVIRTTDYRGVPVLAVYRYIHSLGWGFVAKIDQDEAFAAAEDLQIKSVYIALISIVLVLGVGIHISNSFTIPLKHLESVSQKIAKGDWNTKFEIHSNDEIGSLAKSLGKMQTDLAKYNEELLKSEKLAAIGKLSGSVAHDIRNPLGVISNSIYFLNHVFESEFKGEKARKHLDIMEREIGRANDIISDLMDFSRENKPKKSMGDMNEFIRKIINETNFPDNIDTKIDLDPELPLCEFDPSQMLRVFQNLINNSLDAIDGQGDIAITTAKKKGTLSIVFADTGSGINKEDIVHIFEPLYTTKSKGVGLGLSITKTFIENHKGQIDIVSESGNGAVFTITLPIIYSDVS